MRPYNQGPTKKAAEPCRRIAQLKPMDRWSLVLGQQVFFLMLLLKKMASLRQMRKAVEELDMIHERATWFQYHLQLHRKCIIKKGELYKKRYKSD